MLLAPVCLHAQPDAAMRDAKDLSAPQQSTTGPVPPPGVKPKTPDKVGLKANDKLISGVPGYLWRHGCGPTCVGMVIGYYDSHGYPELIPGDAATQTDQVNQAIASQDSESNPRHYEDYSLPLDDSTPNILEDKSEPPVGDEHSSNCVADFMHTSWSVDNNRYGWSWSNMIGAGFVSYVNLVASEYQPSCADYYPGNPITWSVLTTQIDANMPMVFLVDTDGDGYTDHFVTAIGYRDSQGFQEYACFDTWNPADEVRWEPFRPINAGDTWGIWGGTSFTLSAPPVTPTPYPWAYLVDYLLERPGSSGDDLNEDKKIDIADVIFMMINP
ncbi:hypothetical protein JW926_02195 [Candidatus Sumerlaeota bacterium]|nr:hypothetical protein [Candidatus Sumerlaeota bacterium]